MTRDAFGPGGTDNPWGAGFENFGFPAASLPGGKKKPLPAPKPQAQQQAHAPQAAQATAIPHQQQAPGDWLHPMQREGLNQYHKGIQDTNDAIAREMDSRVEQAREWDERAHEQQLAAMKYQAEMARGQGEMQMRQQELAARAQRNSALMRAAGLGGTTMVNGQPVDSFAPLRHSLLG